MVVGNIGSEPGTSTVLLRTDAGMDAWVQGRRRVRRRADRRPVGRASGWRCATSTARRRTCKRPYDPEGPLWISYTEHQDDYEGTERAAARLAPVPVAPLHGGLLTWRRSASRCCSSSAGRRCVVIGALPVREGKVEALLAGGATDVLVVATAPADAARRARGLSRASPSRVAAGRTARPGRGVPGDRARPRSGRARRGSRERARRERPARWSMWLTISPTATGRCRRSCAAASSLIAIGTGGASPALATEAPRAAREPTTDPSGPRSLRVLARGARGDAPVAPGLRGARRAVGALRSTSTRRRRSSASRRRRGAARRGSRRGCWRTRTRRDRPRRARRARARATPT